MIVTQREREREREAETQAEGEAGSIHREPDVGFDPGSPDRALGQRQAPNRCAIQGSLVLSFYSIWESQSFNWYIKPSTFKGMMEVPQGDSVS